MTSGRRWLAAAAAAGGVHAVFSLYWAVGGRWLLGTVGQWAVELAHDRPVTAGLSLVLVAAAKGLLAALPLAWASGRLHPVRPWRWLLTTGGALLVAYGGLNVAVSWAVLTGVVATDGSYDHAAQLGHAALWDPLFLVWGLALLLGLRALRRDGPGAGRPRGPR